MKKPWASGAGPGIAREGPFPAWGQARANRRAPQMPWTPQMSQMPQKPQKPQTVWAAAGADLPGAEGGPARAEQAGNTQQLVVVQLQAHILNGAATAQALDAQSPRAGGAARAVF